ncbi:unnamed protein product [Cylicocyclus nassatus]|uniref:Methyltransferase-like protein 13 n=1 Tax=Cylicocyclus nassatus TaxID=53992 RepID=A0AA36GMP8_CYLNA|nr:unnamed protein product [Cylicocyclus nassatus]
MRVRPKSRRLFQCITILLLLLCSFYVLQNFYDWSDINAQSELSDKEFAEVFEETYGGDRILEVLELEDGGHIRIIDRPVLSSGKLRAVRYADVKGGFHSYAALLTPKRLTRKDIDTSHWRVDKTVLAQNYYYYRMLAALALCDLIKFTHDCNAHILSVGLGGSTIDGFLHQFFPQMNITVVEISRQVVNMAKKWFGFVENDYHRVVVSDGVKFIAEAAKKGNVFDAILLDACSSDQVEGIICPHESFLSEGVLKNIAHMLPKRGFFVVNVLSEDLKVDEVYQILTKKFKEFFAYCNRLQRPFSMNQVVYCSHQPPTRKPPIDLQQLLNKTFTQSSISFVFI